MYNCLGGNIDNKKYYRRHQLSDNDMGELDNSLLLTKSIWAKISTWISKFRKLVRPYRHLDSNLKCNSVQYKVLSRGECYREVDIFLLQIKNQARSELIRRRVLYPLSL
jgi:hypothetical protein